MTEEATTASAVADMLRVEKEATSKIREQVKEVLVELVEERKELAKLTDLARDMIREYDRLSQRESIHIQALVKIMEELKRV